MEVSVAGQRYRAVLEVRSGLPVTEVAARFGVSRQSVHAWVRRYDSSGLAGLSDRSRRPKSSPGQVSPDIEAVVCEMRREHPRWGPVRIAHELTRASVSPVPSRMSVYRVLVRHGLIEPGPRKRPRDSYVRWERDEPMALWQLDIVGGAFLADGTEAKIVTGVDDHSRYCVICQVVPRATGRAVCLAFAAALQQFGVPGEVLSDNGKQFTDRFGKGGEVLFDRICRDNGITHRLTQPRTPTTTGKIERFHGSLRRELLNDAVPFSDLAAAQAAIDGWVSEYNTTRPHQSLGMATPADRFSTARAKAEGKLLPLRLPAVLALSAAPPASPAPAGPVPEEPAAEPAAVAAPVYDGGPVEFERVVPASGNMMAARRQFWLGPDRSGLTITFWASTEVIHLLIAGARIKTVRSHLTAADLAALAAQGGRPAGPPPLPPAEPGTAIEIDRVVSKDGNISLAGRYLPAAEILAGRRVSIRIEDTTMMIFDPGTRELLRTRPSPLTWDQARKLRGARPAGPPPRPSTEPVTAQRVASNTGSIMIAGQTIALGRIHAHRIVTVHVTADVITIDLGGDDTRTIRRTTTQPVRRIKAQQPRKAAHVS
ncbi:MAG TPA: IS481 family transposase [Trebonia sp.]|nr:IS481 family transposase [Trebonia sp.]